MKTNIFHITAAAILITTSFLAGDKLFNSYDYIPSTGYNSTEFIEVSSSESFLVKAIDIEGEIIPVVDLPELNIVSDSNDGLKVKAKYVNGELIPVVDLPELTIEG